MTAGRKVNTLSQSWGTPSKYVSAVREVFGGNIDLDPCSNQFSIVRATVEYCLPEQDGLKEPWSFNHIYVNPPYGKDSARNTSIKNWLKRCQEAAEEGSEVMALIPVSPNTRHWKDYVFPSATRICFLADTRLRFLIDGRDEGQGAPMECSMIYWGKDGDRFTEVFKKYGNVVKPL